MYQSLVVGVQCNLLQAYAAWLSFFCCRSIFKPSSLVVIRISKILTEVFKGTETYFVESNFVKTHAGFQRLFIRHTTIHVKIDGTHGIKAKPDVVQL